MFKYIGVGSISKHDETERTKKMQCSFTVKGCLTVAHARYFTAQQLASMPGKSQLPT